MYVNGASHTTSNSIAENVITEERELIIPERYFRAGTIAVDGNFSNIYRSVERYIIQCYLATTPNVRLNRLIEITLENDGLQHVVKALIEVLIHLDPKKIVTVRTVRCL